MLATSVPRLTKEKIKGVKFEIWLESLLKYLGFSAYRNIEFHKSRYYYRQVDIFYLIKDGNSVRRAMIEAKYTSSNIIPNKLRRGRLHKSGLTVPYIETIVQEVVERRKFINNYFPAIDYTFLVTNKKFDIDLKENAANEKIKIVEHSDLSALYRKAGGKKTLEESIASVPYWKYNLNPNRIYPSLIKY